MENGNYENENSHQALVLVHLHHIISSLQNLLLMMKFKAQAQISAFLMECLCVYIFIDGIGDWGAGSCSCFYFVRIDGLMV